MTSQNGHTNCYEYWWTNLLYINNFIPDRSAESCFSWGWYLANDMQFYIISPMFIYALYRNRIVGYSFISAGILSCLMAVGIIFNKYGLCDPDSNVETEVQEEFGDHLSVRPYYRIAPYLVGIACADIYMWTKDKVRNMKATWWKVFVVVMWVIALVLNWLILYGYYPYNPDGEPMNPGWLCDLYNSTHRFVWSLSCAWVAYACLTGWGGFINSLLSLKIWEPMGRLCYLAFLLHPIVQYTFLFNMQQTLYFNHWIAAYLFVAYFGVNFGLALVLHLLVEQPLGRLQRLFVKNN